MLVTSALRDITFKAHFTLRLKHIPELNYKITMFLETNGRIMGKEEWLAN
jgi:hypothetical protein